MAKAGLAVDPWRVDIFIDQIPGQRVPLSLIGATFFPTEKEAAEWSEHYNNDLRTSEKVWSTLPQYDDKDAEDRERRIPWREVYILEMQDYNDGFR